MRLDHLLSMEKVTCLKHSRQKSKKKLINDENDVIARSLVVRFSVTVFGHSESELEKYKPYGCMGV